jgi:hypothetical protein
MKLLEILEAVSHGRTVHWGNPGYVVIKDSASHQPLIKCLSTGHCTPLVYRGGLVGEESDFFLDPNGPNG